MTQKLQWMSQKLYQTFISGDKDEKEAEVPMLTEESVINHKAMYISYYLIYMMM